MNRVRFSITFALALALAACGPQPEEAKSAVPLAPSAPPTAAPAVSSTPAAVPPAVAASGPGAELLGKPCSAPMAHQERCRLCDKHDRIAGVVIPVDFLHLDGDLGIFRRSPPGPDADPRRLVFTMTATPDVLRAQVFTCPGCRRPLGWAVVLSFAVLGDLSPAVRSDLQTALGYPATPLLDGAAGFKAATGADPSRDGLACSGGVRR